MISVKKKTNKLYDTIFLGCTACTQIKKLGAQRESLGAPCTRAPANFEHCLSLSLSLSLSISHFYRGYIDPSETTAEPYIPPDNIGKYSPTFANT